MSGIVVQDGGTARTELTRIIKSDDPGVERGGPLGGVVLGTGGDVSAVCIPE